MERCRNNWSLRASRADLKVVYISGYVADLRDGTLRPIGSPQVLREPADEVAIRVLGMAIRSDAAQLLPGFEIGRRCAHGVQQRLAGPLE